MVRTQISLDSELHRRARARATERGISLAEYVRLLLAADLDEGRPPADVSALFNLGSSGGSNIARDKDEMIGEAIEADVLGRR
jgi:hypothetical protein